jgi:hypothetical protein
MPATIDTDAYVSGLADPDGAIRELLNPVTRTSVILKPPFTPQSADHEVGFIRLFCAYCQAAWAVGRLDPDTLTLHGGNATFPDYETPTPLWPGTPSES